MIFIPITFPMVVNNGWGMLVRSYRNLLVLHLDYLLILPIQLVHKKSQFFYSKT